MLNFKTIFLLSLESKFNNYAQTEFTTETASEAITSAD